MPQEFSAYSYVEYVRGRWRFIAIACATAVGLALIAGLLTAPRYSATARVVIEPPAASDPRAAMAVSPIYLESLKTYELFASSDNVFLQAVERFGLRQNDSRPVDQLKRSVLKVSIPRNTKVLEITVRLGDPKRAHALAQHLAEEVVKLSRKVSRDGDLELTSDVEHQIKAARQRLSEVEQEDTRTANANPVAELEEQINSLADRKSKIQARLAEDELAATEADTVQARALRARVEAARKHTQDLERQIAARHTLLRERTARRDSVLGRLKSAQALVDSLENRLQETQALVGGRSERLKIIDPGIVPERPSSPNIPLNVLAAFLIALVFCVVKVTLEFVGRARSAEAARPALRFAGRGDD